MVMGDHLTVMGCGYVGSALAEYWQQQGHRVTGTTTRAERIKVLEDVLSNVVMLQGDDAAAVVAVSQGRDAVVVSVAPPQAQAGNPAVYAATYLPIVRNLAKAIEQAESACRVIYLSSCSIYGDRQGDWVNETAPIVPTTEHMRILQEAEQTLLQSANAIQQVCILRLGGIYGPGRELLKRYAGLAGKTLPGKGDRVINWIHLADIVGVIEFARANQLSGIYNVVDDSVMAVRDPVALVCNHHQLPPVLWDESRSSQATKNLRVSNQKLKAAGYPLIYPRLMP